MNICNEKTKMWKDMFIHGILSYHKKGLKLMENAEFFNITTC